MTGSRLDRVRLLLLREELRSEEAALEESLRSTEAALAGVEKLLARPGRTTQRDAAIIAAVQGGEKQKDVAERYGITQQRVSLILKAHQNAQKAEMDLLPNPEDRP